MSGIVLPNGAPAPSADNQLETVQIGGVPLEYQPDPLKGVVMNPQFLQHPTMMVQLFTGLINTNHAQTRELVALRERLDEVEQALAQDAGAPNYPFTPDKFDDEVSDDADRAQDERDDHDGPGEEWAPGPNDDPREKPIVIDKTKDAE